MANLAETVAYDLEAKPGEPPQGAAPITQEATVGRYRLMRMLGEGGMGSVYLAEQTEPVRRKVALKLIKLGMDSKAVVQRFEQERQIGRASCRER